jgi:hypothetical protein
MFFEKQKQKRVTERRRCSAALQQNEDSAGNTNSAALQANEAGSARYSYELVGLRVQVFKFLECYKPTTSLRQRGSGGRLVSQILTRTALCRA